MSKLFNVGKIVLKGLLYAHKDGRIDASEVLTIFNQCADEVGLSIRLNDADKHDIDINKRLSELKDIERLKDENDKKTFEMIEQGQMLEDKTALAKRAVNDAIDKSARTEYPNVLQPVMTKMMQVKTSDKHRHQAAIDELNAVQATEIN